MSTQWPVCRPLVARIFPEAFQSNALYLQRQAPDSELLLVIKANAYGHGIEHFKTVCEGYRVAVASAEEALTLNEAGYENQIVLLEGPFSPKCVELMLGRPAIWVVNNLRQLEYLDAAGFEGKIWLKIDSGMHRLGLSPQEFEAALSKVSASSKLVLDALMSHFSSADDLSSAKTKRQLQMLDELIAMHRLQDVPVSCCNSAGLLFHPDAHKDVVRPGISLYGGWCAQTEERSREGLSPVMSLESEVIAIRDLSVGECVGYGETWCAERPTRLATVAVGYGDGYPRHAPNGTPVFVQGQEASLVGRVSMDMITVDVTDIDQVDIGSKVELWGADLPVERVALAIGTISYELTTALTARVPRVRA